MKFFDGAHTPPVVIFDGAHTPPVMFSNGAHTPPVMIFDGAPPVKISDLCSVLQGNPNGLQGHY